MVREFTYASLRIILILYGFLNYFLLSGIRMEGYGFPIDV